MWSNLCRPTTNICFRISRRHSQALAPGSSSHATADTSRLWATAAPHFGSGIRTTTRAPDFAIARPGPSGAARPSAAYTPAVHELPEQLQEAPLRAAVKVLHGLAQAEDLGVGDERGGDGQEVPLRLRDIQGPGLRPWRGEHAGDSLRRFVKIHTHMNISICWSV